MDRNKSSKYHNKGKIELNRFKPNQETGGQDRKDQTLLELLIPASRSALKPTLSAALANSN